MEKKYRKAYYDMKKFFKQRGFEHRQHDLKDALVSLTAASEEDMLSPEEFNNRI